MTNRERLAELIDDGWFYSWHWKDDTWEEQAKQELKTRWEYHNRQYQELKEAQEIINKLKE